MTVGERIKQRRKELGLTVDEVAERLGKNRATVYRYESNEIENLPTPILEPLARVLETTPEYLIGWKNEQKENSSSIKQDRKAVIKQINSMSDDRFQELKGKLQFAGYLDPDPEEE